MKAKIFLLALALLGTTAIRATNFLDSLQYIGRIDYALGGTAPIGMPETIRELNNYKLRASFGFGIDAHKAISKRWGIMAGLHLNTRGMYTDAEVKNYHMEMRQGGEHLDGQFTGAVVTKVSQWLITVPILATYDISPKVRLKAGPYIAVALHNDFSGYAYDGYLREGSPTGPKVEIGSDAGSRGEYDFSEDLRHFQWGLQVGADWYFGKRWGVSADLTWGLSGVFKSSFTTIEQTMYPIYGVVGLSYRL